MAKRSAIREKIVLEVLILLASIPVFRGFWHLTDLYLLPENPLASAWISLIAGLTTLVAVLHYFNRPHIKSRLKNL